MSETPTSTTEVHATRMARFARAGLYLVTSASLSAGRSTPEVVAAALRGGVKLVQLREKGLPLRELLALARVIREQTEAAGALLIVNDRVDVALAVGADGVHLGQDDFPVDAARRLAPDLVIGASTHSIGEAQDAIALGASYVNIGPIFPTQTKSDWQGAFLGIDGLREIAAHVSVPFTVMGGIKHGHVPALVEAGATAIAVVTAVTAAEDPERAARELLRTIGDTRAARDRGKELRPESSMICSGSSLRSTGDRDGRGISLPPARPGSA